ncbi:uncharacterized protein LOC107800657 [Nicotiana tabacum]|uniref:Uncharacterized protein LOC107800657 n=2 Tax=Nicotiana TaxID=4085 RepID=A0A1S4ARI3_TOBAC|nr:PREDICTED: uncharacterized protein LOC104215589 [Nicotiana sylvestris]XP_016479357.1 PREDICTED: uncharacterized protein LOC107800657 [Nicotiana tabacum]
MTAKVMKLIEVYYRSYICSGTNTITKKALIAWEKKSLPKSVGGYNLINLKVWNKAAVTKIHWDLAQKEDKAWTRWIHVYYIKGQSIPEMNIPQQAIWMMRKIMEARKTMQQVLDLKQRQSVIKHIYLGLLGNHNKVEWRPLIFYNEARPKAVSTMWIQCHERMLTADRLTKWGIQVSPRCSLCLNADESHLHLFGECSFSRLVWLRLLRWLQIWDAPMNPWSQVVIWLILQSKGKLCKSKILKMMYAEYIYGIWKERNSRIFEDQTRNEEQIVREVSCICNIRT